MDLRNSRLWQDSLAHATVFEGDALECGKWLGWAKQKLQFMLHSIPGASSQVHAPADGVVIRIDTRPNRISIAAGGIVFPTIMNPTGDSSAYPNNALPPYQSIQQRRVYKTPSSYITKLDYFAGGEQSTPYEGTSVGGHWFNPSGRCISWTDTTLFMAGKFCNSQYVPLGYHIHCAGISPDSKVVVLYRAAEFSPSRYNYQMIRYDVTSKDTYQFYLGGYETLSIGDIISPHLLTGFDKTCTHLAYVDRPTAPSVQTVRLITIADNFLSHSVSSIYTRVYGYATVSTNQTVTITPPGAYVWVLNSDVSATLTPGDARIEGIDMGHERIVLFGPKLVSYSVAKTLVDDSRSFSSETSTAASRVKFTLESLSFTGVTAALSETPELKFDYARTWLFEMSEPFTTVTQTESYTSEEDSMYVAYSGYSNAMFGVVQNLAITRSENTAGENDGGGGVNITAWSQPYSETYTHRFIANTTIVHSDTATATTDEASPAGESAKASQLQDQMSYLSAVAPSEADSSYISVPSNSVNLTRNAFSDKLCLFTHKETQIPNKSYIVCASTATPTNMLLEEGIIKPVSSTYESQVGLTN